MILAWTAVIVGSVWLIGGYVYYSAKPSRLSSDVEKMWELADEVAERRRLADPKRAEPDPIWRTVREGLPPSCSPTTRDIRAAVVRDQIRARRAMESGIYPAHQVTSDEALASIGARRPEPKAKPAPTWGPIGEQSTTPPWEQPFP